MRDFQRKSGWKNIVQSAPVLIFLCVLLLFFTYIILGFFNKMRITIENRKNVETKVAELQEQKEKLSSDIASLKTQKGVEASIREKFGLAKEGEGEIVVVDEKNPPETEKKNSNWFLNFFKGIFR